MNGRRAARVIGLGFLFVALAACDDSDNPTNGAGGSGGTSPGAGGSTGTGGGTTMGTGGAMMGVGGVLGTGGMAMGTGGMHAMGGMMMHTGGMHAMGGMMMHTGGMHAMGGMMMGTGGMHAMGGMMMGTGGMHAMGGMMASMGGRTMGIGGRTMGMGGAASVDGGPTDALAACRAEGTLQVTNSGASAYVIDGAANPNLTLCRGSSYVFAVNAPGHPFYIKTVQGTGTAYAYDSGITGNGATNGNVTFEVPADAPDTLYYICSLHAPMTGVIHIVDQ